MFDDSNDPLAAMFDPNRKISKAERIRDYIGLHPDSKNHEIATALAESGVRYQDVTNTRQRLKSKEVADRKAERARSASEKKVGAQASKQASESGADDRSKPNYVELGLIDHGIEFVRLCGDIHRAEEVLAVIRRIREL